MATFTLPHIAIQASGTLGGSGGNEIWSFGYKLALSEEGTPGVLEIPTQADLAAAADSALGAISSFIGAAPGGGPTAGLISEWCRFTSVKAAAIGPDSKVDSALNTEIRDVIPAVVGQASISTPNAGVGHQTPYQVALVVTLRGTQYTRGPAAFGRFYIPVPNLHVDPAGITDQAMVNGLLQQPQVALFATQAGLLVQNQQVPAEGSGRIVRVANISQSQVQNAVRWQPVTTVSVDNRPDTVRSRYNKLSGQGRADVVISLP